jgi:hypothetical protein
MRLCVAIVISVVYLTLFGMGWAYDGPTVVDDANFLDGEQLVELEYKVRVANSENDFFLVILTVPTLENQRIDLYAKAVLTTWEIGHEQRDDGLLLLIARDESAFRFHPGLDAQKAVDTVRLQQITNSILKPSFQREEYLAGLLETVEALGHREGGVSVYSALWVALPAFLLIFLYANTLNRKRRRCPGCGRQVSPLVSCCPGCLCSLRSASSEPCPCGSGRAYRECCLDEHEAGRDSYRLQFLRLLDLRYLMWQSTGFGGYTGGGPGDLPPKATGAKRFDGTGIAGRF